MQISVVAFKLVLIVAAGLGKPGKIIVRSDRITRRSDHNNDADSRNDEDNESKNSYNYDDTGGGVYDKMDQIIYPFQQYIQVRNSYSVEHLPIQEESSTPDTSPKSASTSANEGNPIRKSPRKQRRPKNRNKANNNRLNLDTSASTNNDNKDRNDEEDESNDTENNDDEDDASASHGNGHESYDHGSSYADHKPRLIEEVDDYKKQEVYEEKGYADGAYDHGGYGTHADHQYGHQGRDDNNNVDDGYENEQEQSPPTTEESRQSKSYHRSRPRSRTPHLSELPTSTKLLEYAATKLYDKDAHEKGIYAARDHIHCPEVIDFDLSSKKMGMGKGGNNPPGSKPRLRGLGDKIKCLKEKYFGVQPLPPQIFMEPSESRMSVIQMPTFDQFYKSVRDEVDSISSFQHF